MKKLFIIPVLVISFLLVGNTAFATTTDISSPVNGSINTAKPTTFTGNTVSNGQIDLQEDGTTIASTTADVNGDWSIATSNIKAGTHNYTAVSVQPEFNIAFMNGQAEQVIETVDVNNHQFLNSIALPNTSSSHDLVVRNSTLYVPIDENAYSQQSVECSILEYELPEMTLTDQISIAGECSAGNIDVNPAGTMAVVAYLAYDFSSYHLVAVDLTNNTVIDNIDTGYTMTDGIVFDKDGQSFFMRIGGGVAKFHVENDAIQTDDAQGYGQEFSPAIAVSPTTGQITVAEVGNGNIRLINPDDLNDTTEIHVADNATNFNRLAYSHDGTKLIVVGLDGDGNHVWEINTSTGSVANDYPLTDFPESVGYTPDDSQYVIGDNFGSGTIFFGTPGGSNFTDSIVQPIRSYAMRNTNFIYSMNGSDASEPVSLTNVFVVASYGTDPNGNISSKTVAPGASVEVSGSGFQAGSDITITLHSSPIVLKTLKTNSSGAFSTAVTIPKGTSLGAHSLEISGKDAAGNNVSSVLNLTVAILPATGNNTRSNAIFAVVLIAGGFVLVQAKRRALLS